MNMRINVLIVISGFIFILLMSGCENKVDEMPFKIALSKGSPENSYANYYNWIRSLDSTITCRDMYDMPLDSAMMLFKE
ncbi:MAG: hypothetical protein HGA23_05990, partial [Bacteroidales bacterium]|nr:hypothetical protein [Bacteroidales bacterium]